MPDISILIAHKHALRNDNALRVALTTFIENTGVDYELLVDSTTPADPYRVYNKLAEQARAEWLVFANSDTFPARNWITPMLDLAQPDTIVTPILVECGAMGIATDNVLWGFGMTPETFQRSRFEEWANTPDAPIPSGDGWYFPCLMHRETFLQMGKFDTERGAFPDPLDIWFWDNWRKAGKQVKKARSYFYHLQNWSNEHEQLKAIRYAPVAG